MKTKELFRSFRRNLARLWLNVNLQLTVIGVTGSYGKTSAVRAISEVLSAKYSVNRTDLNLDTIYNLPITILKTKVWNEFLVLEYGVDHVGEMDRHLSLVKPKIAVLTGITPVHSDKEHLGSLENIIAEKRKLIEALPANGLAIFNYDDEEVRKIGSAYSSRKIFYGTNSKADIWADKIEITPKGTGFNLHDSGKEIMVETGILGYPAVYSSLAAYIVGKEFKVEKEKMLLRLKTLKPLPGKFSIEPGPLGTTLINDAKRANPASTIAGLKSLSEFSGRKVAVLGEMGELGDLEKKMHEKVGEEAARLKIDIIVGVGPLTKFIIAEASKKGMKKSQLFWASDVSKAAEVLKKILKKDDLLYLKASLLRHLERVILLLEGQKISCQKTSCSRYDSCTTCRYLNTSVK